MTPATESPYESPVLTDLGSLADLTQGDAGGTGDGLNGTEGDTGSFSF